MPKLLFITLLLTACGSDDQICKDYDWELNICPLEYIEPETYTSPTVVEPEPINRTPTRPNGGEKRYNPYESYTNDP